MFSYWTLVSSRLCLLIQVLSELIDHHVKEEEGHFFPEARKLLGTERLAELGDEITAAKEAEVPAG